MFTSKLLASIWVLFATIGYVVYSIFDRGDGTFYDLHAEDINFTSSILAHILAAFSLYLGAFLFARVFRRSTRTPLQLLRHDNTNISDEFLQITTVLTTLVCTVSNLFAYGWDGLIYRTYYIPDANIFIIIAQLFGVLTTLLAAILACRSSRKSKSVALVCFLVALTLIFAKGSRYAVIAFIIFQLLPSIVGAERSHSGLVMLKILITVFLSFFLLHASLFFRSDSQYGLAPYITKLPEAYYAISDMDYKSLWDSFLNITFSVPVTEVTIQNGVHDIASLLISLSPLSGDSVGWYEIAQSRRISEEIPFSALGELYGYSPLILVFYFLFVGAVFSIVEYELENSHPKIRGFLVLFSFGFCLLFGLFVLQYNLRSSTRMIYYLAGVLIVSRIYTQFLMVRQFK